MKRSGPPKRKTPLTSNKQWPPRDRPRKALPRQSVKRKAEQPARAKVREVTLRRAGYRCQLRDVVPEVQCWHPAGEPLDVDEIAQRGVAPGGHLDSSNTQAVCRAHHQWKTDNRIEAEKRGVRMSGEEYRRRDPVAEQDEAAARFKAAMGREASDPSPPGYLGMQMVNGRVQAVTSGYDRNPDTADIDWFERRGITHRHHDELSGRPTAVFLRAPGGTDPRVALGAVFDEMFGEPEEPDHVQVGDVIDVDVVE